MAAWSYYRKALAWLSRPENQPDIIHAHYGFPDGVVGSAVAKALGVPCVVSLHGDDANLQLRLPVAGRLIAHSLSKADALIAVSEAMRRDVAERFPSLAPLLVRIPNGYDAGAVHFAPHLPAEYFLFVGTLLPVKNPDILVRAYARIAHTTGLDLAIAGEGPLEDEVRELAEELGVARRVRFLGRLAHEDVGHALRRAQALVLPSSHEGMPIVVLEALATGTPVVASAVGGVPELVHDDERLGVLVPPDDEEGLVRGLLRALTRSWNEDEIRDEAPILTWAENAERVLGVYQRVMERRGETAGERKLVYLSLQATSEGQAAHAHVNGIVDGLRERGWRVDLFEPEYGATAPGPIGRLAEFARVQWHLCRDLSGAQSLYCRAHFAAVPSALVAWRRHVPVVHEVNGTWEDLFLAWPWTRRFGSLFIGLTRFQWRRADALVTVTEPLASWAERQAGDVPVEVVPNAADTRLFRPEAEARPGMPERYVVFVGALATWQGLPTLLDATSDPAWPKGVEAVIVGDGAERPAVEAAVAEGRPVRYLGRVPHAEVPGIVSAAIAALSPQNAGGGRSLTGLSPVKVYESLACDTPVIVTDYPGQSELVRDAACGIVVPAEDPAALARAVRELAAHPAKARAMGARGGQTVRQQHSWDARAAQTDRLLRRLAARSAVAAVGGRRATATFGSDE